MTRIEILALSAAGLAVLGLAVVSAPRPVSGAAQADATASPDSAPPAAVLLLVDGRVIDKGPVVETDEGYLVRTAFGPLNFKRTEVVQTFGSISEVYQYKFSRIPERDPDERMKLAQWCLDRKLYPEARAELEAVLELSPDRKQARAMLFQIETVSQAPPADPGVVRTSAEQVEPPATISSDLLREIREEAMRSPVPLGMPVIFDLPQPLAVKRHQEFRGYVHRALQQKCARCHNEQSESTFQLIQARTRRDLENEYLVRANLDATLRLINPQDPAQSELLTRSISPHQPDNRPILTGPNDPTYRLLAYWVHGLRSPTASVATRSQPQSPSPATPGQAPVAGPGTEAPTAPLDAPRGGFASDRTEAAVSPLPDLTPTPTPTTVPDAGEPAQGGGARVISQHIQLDVPPAPAGQMLPGGTPTGPPPAAVPESAFPTSPLLGGPNPAPVGPGQPHQAAPGGAAANPTGAAAPPTINVPGLGDIPVMDTRTMPAQATSNAEEPAEPKRAPSLNRDALQQFMSGRAGAR